MRVETVTSMSIAASCVFFICLLLLGDATVSFLVFLQVVLVDLGLLAFLHLLGMTFEFISSIFLVIAVGFSVDYSAHIAHGFIHSTGTAEERVRAGMGKMAKSVLNGGFTTWLAVSLLPASQSYVFGDVIYKCVSLVVTLGLWHGLVGLLTSFVYFYPL